MEELDRCESDLIVVMGEKTECLERGDNLGAVYHHLEKQYQEGLYQCEEFEHFYAYKRVERD